MKLSYLDRDKGKLPVDQALFERLERQGKHYFITLNVEDVQEHFPCSERPFEYEEDGRAVAATPQAYTRVKSSASYFCDERNARKELAALHQLGWYHKYNHFQPYPEELDSGDAELFFYGERGDLLHAYYEPRYN